MSIAPWLARRLLLLVRDRAALALTALLPVLIVLAVQLPLARRGVPERETVFFLYLVFAFWIGLNTAAREVVSRRAAWRRELLDGVPARAASIGALLFAALPAAWAAAVFTGGLSVEAVRWPVLEARFFRDGRVADRLEATLLDAVAALPLSERRALAHSLTPPPPDTLSGRELTAWLRTAQAADARRWADRFAPPAAALLRDFDEAPVPAEAEAENIPATSPPDGASPAAMPAPEAPSSSMPSASGGGSGLSDLLPSDAGGAPTASWRRRRTDWVRGAVAAWCADSDAAAALAPALANALENELDRLTEHEREVARAPVWLAPSGLLTATADRYPGWPTLWRAWTVLAATALCGAWLGLWVSVRAATPEGAAQWVPLLTIPQILFSPELLRHLPDPASRHGFGVLGLGHPFDPAWRHEQTVAGALSLLAPCRHGYRWLSDFVYGADALAWGTIGGTGVFAWEGVVLGAMALLCAAMFMRGVRRRLPA